MTKKIRILSVVVLTTVFAGCNYLPKLEPDKVEYKSARRLPQLEIPPDLARPAADESYAVPDLNPKGEATYSTYSKERAGSGNAASAQFLPSPENARIERAGNQRWLVVKAEASTVWDVVREFWEENGYVIDSEDRTTGVMETDWSERRATIPDDNILRSLLAKMLSRTQIHTTGGPTAPGELVKFRTRLERGSDPTQTEIYISHRGMEEEFTSSSREKSIWKMRAPDPELEAEMLSKLMVRFGVKPAALKVQALVALAEKPQPPRATLVKAQGGTGMLTVNDQFDRAWRRVGLALDRVGFTVEDRDRSQGLYYVRYADPDANSKTAKEKGFFSRMNPFSSDKKVSNEQFRIQVKDAADTSQVSVLNKEGAQEVSETATRILGLLFEQLK